MSFLNNLSIYNFFTFVNLFNWNGNTKFFKATFVPVNIKIKLINCQIIKYQLFDSLGKVSSKKGHPEYSLKNLQLELPHVRENSNKLHCLSQVPESHQGTVKQETSRSKDVLVSL